MDAAVLPLAGHTKDFDLPFYVECLVLLSTKGANTPPLQTRLRYPHSHAAKAQRAHRVCSYRPSMSWPSSRDAERMHASRGGTRKHVEVLLNPSSTALCGKHNMALFSSALSRQRECSPTEVHAEPRALFGFCVRPFRPKIPEGRHKTRRSLRVLNFRVHILYTQPQHYRAGTMQLLV